jgi:hypothetical protein
MALASRPAGLRAAPGRADTRPAGRPRGLAPRAAAQQQREPECGTSAPAEAPPSRRALLRGLAGLAAGASLAAARAPPARAEPAAAAAGEGYLLSTGARGPIAEEEARLVQLRKELEGEVRRELEAERAAEVR